MVSVPASVETARGQSDIIARWLAGIGFFLLLGSGALATRLIWEMTVWSWEQGPQMVGFRLMHGGGGLLLFFPLLLIGWLGIAVLYLALRAWRRRTISPACLVVTVLSVVMLGVLWLPYGFWLRVFVDRAVTAPHASEFTVLAAAYGDLATVRTFVAHGISPNARSRWGRTALEAAAAGGHANIVEYLKSVGADADRMSDEQAKRTIDQMAREGIQKDDPLLTDPAK